MLPSLKDYYMNKYFYFFVMCLMTGGGGAAEPTETMRTFSHQKRMVPCNNEARIKGLRGLERKEFMSECLLVGSSIERDEAPSQPRNATPASWTDLYAGKRAHLTLSKYYDISDGMTYREVVETLGGFGQEISSNYMEGVAGVMPSVRTVMYQWIGAGGANMNAMFQNNKLISKAQFGLR